VLISCHVLSAKNNFWKKKYVLSDCPSLYMIYHDLPSSWKVDRSWFDDELVNINTSPFQHVFIKTSTKENICNSIPHQESFKKCKKTVSYSNIYIIYINIIKLHVHQGNPPRELLFRLRIRITPAPRRGCGADGRPGAGHSAADGGGLATSQCMEVFSLEPEPKPGVRGV